MNQDDLSFLVVGIVVGILLSVALNGVIHIDQQMVDEEMLHNICRDFMNDSHSYADLDHSSSNLMCYHDNQESIQVQARQ